MSDVVIFGIGDYARIAQLYLAADSPHEVVAFTAHRDYVDRDELNGIPVIAFEELERQPSARRDVDARRGRVLEGQPRADGDLRGVQGARLRARSATSAPRRWSWPDVPIGDNMFIFEGNVVQPGVTIGSHVRAVERQSHRPCTPRSATTASSPRTPWSPERDDRRALLRRRQRDVPRRDRRRAGLRDRGRRADHERHGARRRLTRSPGRRRTGRRAGICGAFR